MAMATETEARVGGERRQHLQEVASGGEGGRGKASVSECGTAFWRSIVSGSSGAMALSVYECTRYCTFDLNWCPGRSLEIQ